MLDANATVYDYWLGQIQVMAHRMVDLPVSKPGLQVDGLAMLSREGDNPPHRSRVAFQDLKRDFQDRWLRTSLTARAE